MYPAWTPDYVLDRLSPRLFFRMLAEGRAVDRRHRFREYYEKARIALMPMMTPENRDKVSSYYWENSLSENEKAARDRVVAQAREDAKKSWLPPSAALDFFRRR